MPPPGFGTDFGRLGTIPTPLTLPETPTPAILDVLSLMTWDTGIIAQCFRLAGRDIPTKCECEQAHVLFWALGFALRHGDDWRKMAAAELREMQVQVAKKEAAA